MWSCPEPCHILFTFYLPLVKNPTYLNFFFCGLEIVSQNVNEYNRKEESHKSISKGKRPCVSDLDYHITEEPSPTPRNHGLLK